MNTRIILRRQTCPRCGEQAMSVAEWEYVMEAACTECDFHTSAPSIAELADDLSIAWRYRQDERSVRSEAFADAWHEYARYLRDHTQSLRCPLCGETTLTTTDDTYAECECGMSVSAQTNAALWQRIARINFAVAARLRHANPLAVEQHEAEAYAIGEIATAREERHNERHI